MPTGTFQPLRSTVCGERTPLRRVERAPVLGDRVEAILAQGAEHSISDYDLAPSRKFATVCIRRHNDLRDFRAVEIRGLRLESAAFAAGGTILAHEGTPFCVGNSADWVIIQEIIADANNLHL